MGMQGRRQKAVKKYVFLTFDIFGIGGTQIYVRNKLLFMQSKGWEPIIFTTVEGKDVVVKELMPFTDCVMPEMLIHPYMYSAKDRRSILDKIHHRIGEADEIIIEANFMQITPWAEELAKYVHGRCFIFLIQEDYNISASKLQRFFDYKLTRGELAVNTPVAMRYLLKGIRNINQPQDYFLAATCHNVVEDSDDEEYSAIKNADVHIGSIGRLNKPYVLPMTKSIVEYVKKHQKQTYQLVFFGGSAAEKDYEAIKEAVKETENLSVYITGPIFPIPRRMLQKIDLFVSTAGSALTSFNEGLPTIAMDATDYLPIGILGYTTNQIIHREEGKPVPQLSDLIDCILSGNACIDYEKEKNCAADYRVEFENHIKYIDRCERALSYYDVKKTAPCFVTRINYRITGKTSNHLFAAMKRMMRKAQ